MTRTELIEHIRTHEPSYTQAQLEDMNTSRFQYLLRLLDALGNIQSRYAKGSFKNLPSRGDAPRID